MKKTFEILLTCMALFFISNFNTAKAQPIMPVFIAEVKMGENIHIKSGEVKESDVISIGGKIYIDGVVNGGIMAVGGDIHISGNVYGKATSIGGKVIVNKDGKVSGEVSEIGKNVKELLGSNYENTVLSNKYKSSAIKGVIFIIMFAIAIFIYKYAPKNIIEISSNLGSTLKKDIIYGYCSVMITLFIIVALIITILGTLAIPAIVILVFITGMIGFTAICMSMGKWICRKLRRDLSSVFYIFIGLGVLFILINVIALKLSIILLLLFVIPISIGTCINSRFGTFKSWRRYGVEKWDWYNQK